MIGAAAAFVAGRDFADSARARSNCTPSKHVIGPGIAAKVKTWSMPRRSGRGRHHAGGEQRL